MLEIAFKGRVQNFKGEMISSSFSEDGNLALQAKEGLIKTLFIYYLEGQVYKLQYQISLQDVLRTNSYKQEYHWKSQNFNYWIHARHFIQPTQQCQAKQSIPYQIFQLDSQQRKMIPLIKKCQDHYFDKDRLIFLENQTLQQINLQSQEQQTIFEGVNELNIQKFKGSHNLIINNDKVLYSGDQMTSWRNLQTRISVKKVAFYLQLDIHKPRINKITMEQRTSNYPEIIGNHKYLAQKFMRSNDRIKIYFAKMIVLNLQHKIVRCFKGQLSHKCNEIINQKYILVEKKQGLDDKQQERIINILTGQQQLSNHVKKSSIISGNHIIEKKDNELMIYEIQKI